MAAAISWLSLIPTKIRVLTPAAVTAIKKPIARREHDGARPDRRNYHLLTIGKDKEKKCDGKENGRKILKSPET